MKKKIFKRGMAGLLAVLTAFTTLIGMGTTALPLPKPLSLIWSRIPVMGTPFRFMTILPGDTMQRPI